MTIDSACLLVRRQLMLDPEISSIHLYDHNGHDVNKGHDGHKGYGGDKELDSHIESCEACKRYQNKLLEQNHLIRDALEVPIPEGLNERILLQRYTESKRGWQSWAMVASIALMFVGYLAMLPNKITHDWALIAAQHVADEPNTISSEKKIPDIELLNALKEWGISTASSIGNVTYLDHCDMPNGKGLHVVFTINGKQKNSLIVLPIGTQLSHLKARYGDYYASAIPVGGSALAVISDTPQELEVATRWIERHMVAL